jgi:hypothetical protein
VSLAIGNTGWDNGLTLYLQVNFLTNLVTVFPSLAVSLFDSYNVRRHSPTCRHVRSTLLVKASLDATSYAHVTVRPTPCR